MTIKYLAGNRVQGTRAERTSFGHTTSPTKDLTSFTGTTGYSTSTNSITMNTGSNAWATTKIQSTITFTVGEAFSIECSPSASGTTGFFGLGQGTLAVGAGTGQNMSNSMIFGMLIAGESKVIEYDGTSGGTLKNTQATFNAADVYKITVDVDGTVKYWRQASGTGVFNKEYTSAVKASGIYYFQGNHQANATGFTGIKYMNTEYTNETVFEETDTHKSYIWNATTKVWTEIT